jgi:hypothetical protein
VNDTQLRGLDENEKVTCKLPASLKAALHYSAGIANLVFVENGLPKLGEPSLFQVNGCARGDLKVPHPCPALSLAWYKIQFSFPLGETKKELFPPSKDFPDGGFL